MLGIIWAIAQITIKTINSINILPANQLKYVDMTVLKYRYLML